MAQAKSLFYKLLRWNIQWFTLVELIVVIAIIAVLAVIAWLTLTQWVWEGRDSRVQSDVGTIARGLEVHLDNPDTITGLTGSDGVLNEIDDAWTWDNYTYYAVDWDADDEKYTWLEHLEEVSQAPSHPAGDEAEYHYYVAVND